MRLEHATWIKDNRRFQRLYRHGRFHNLKELSFYFSERRDGEVHLALSIARKLKGAVHRNRAKRRIRAYFRMLDGRFKPGQNLIIMARPGVNEADFHDLYRRLEKALLKAGRIFPEGETPAPPDAE